MTRRLLVQVLAALAVLMLATAAVAATGPFATEPEDIGTLEVEAGGDESPFGLLRAAEVRAFGACMREAAGDEEAQQGCDDLRPAPAHEHPAHPVHGDGGEVENGEVENGEVENGENENGENENGDNGDGENFGLLRSAEVRAFGECMHEAAGEAEAREACDELRPRPAHEHPAHPAGPPDHAGRPDRAEPDDDIQPLAGDSPAGPPAHAGPPAGAGPPAEAGPPAHAGPPADAGPPAGRGGR